MANREERFLMRQRGAGARQIDALNFNFELPTADQVPLQPVKSGRGRPRKTPQRESLPPSSSRKTPKVQTSSKRGRPSKSSSSNASKGLKSSINSDATKVDSVRRGTRSSSQPMKSDESGRVIKKRRVNGVIKEVVPTEIVDQRGNGLPDIQESLQEDAIPDPPAIALNIGEEVEVDAESPLASKAPAAKKRKKRKSIAMKPRKRATVDMMTALQKYDVESKNTPYAIEAEPESAARENEILESEMLENELQEIEEQEKEMQGNEVQENEVLQEMDDNVSKAPATWKRKRKKSKTTEPRKRINVEVAAPLEKAGGYSSDLQNTNASGTVAGDLMAQDNEVQESEIVQEVKNSAQGRSGLPRRRKKRKSVLQTTKSKRKPASPLQTKSHALKGLDNSSSAPTVSQARRSQGESEEPRAHQEPDTPSSMRQESGITQHASVPRRRGRPPGSRKVGTAPLPQANGEEVKQTPAITEEVVRENKCQTHSLPKRRGRPPGSLKIPHNTTKSGKASQSQKMQTTSTGAQKRKSKKSQAELVKEKQKVQEKKPAKVLEKKPTKEAKSTKRSAKSIPITVHQIRRPAEYDSEDEVTSDTGPFLKKRGVDAIDILGQYCYDIIDQNLGELEEEAEITVHKTTRKALRTKRKVVQDFKEDLEEAFLRMTEAVDHNDALKKRLRQAKKDKTTARKDLLSIQKQVEEAAIELDVARMAYEEMSTQNKRTNDLNMLLHDIEKAVKRGKAQQLRDMENGNTDDAKTMEGLEFSMQTGPANVNSVEGDGLLDQVTNLDPLVDKAVLCDS